MATILIAEDEKKIQRIIADYAKKAGHFVLVANDGTEALIILKNYSVDLLILDIMMPSIDGYEVCKQARKISELPIIFLTAKSAEADKLQGYQLGADDYVTKPFSPNVLMAKVQALLKRIGKNQANETLLRVGQIVLDKKFREVTINDTIIKLTHTEYELLLLFMQNPKQVFSREQLLNCIWGYDFEGTTRTVDVHVKNLRQKLGGEGQAIVTLIRSGYKLEVNADD
ncbi:response regulator transcription factor [Enterococcus sp. DIV0756]|uniref:response regulator transcription factor n=1 Tax=Enterococcus sp. DIV0756 TaxID=2774636 RepID=UPI003F20C1BF